MNRPDGHHPSTVKFLTEAPALEEGLRCSGNGLWRWKIDSDQLEWTRNLEEVHRLAAGTFDGTLSSFQRDIHPDDADAVWQKIMVSVETGTPYRAVYRTAPRADESEHWIETAGAVTTDTDGSRYLTGVCFDVSERVSNELQLVRRLAQQRAVAHFGTFALNERDLQTVLDEATRVAAETLGVPLAKILQFADAADHLLLRAGTGWKDGLVGHAMVGIDRASQAGFTLLSKDPVIVRDLLTETRFSGPQLLHDYEVRSGISVVIPGLDARPFGVFGIHARDLREFDQTDAEFLVTLANIVAGATRQVAAADHHLLLVREMAHRAGNMLQLVSSIARQTFRAQADPQLAQASFNERLKALARANHVVARGGWTSTSFAALVEEALRPFGDRVNSKGRDVLLPPEFCFDMGLVLHELATNSAKYGALGADEGAVDIDWSVCAHAGGGRAFSFKWSDPHSNFSGPPERSGFGSELINTLVEKKWDGNVTREESPHYCIILEVPLSL